MSPSRGAPRDAVLGAVIAVYSILMVAGSLLAIEAPPVEAFIVGGGVRVVYYDGGLVVGVRGLETIVSWEGGGALALEGAALEVSRCGGSVFVAAELLGRGLIYRVSGGSVEALTLPENAGPVYAMACADVPVAASWSGEYYYLAVIGGPSASLYRLSLPGEGEPVALVYAGGYYVLVTRGGIVAWVRPGDFSVESVERLVAGGELGVSGALAARGDLLVYGYLDERAFIAGRGYGLAIRVPTGSAEAVAATMSPAGSLMVLSRVYTDWPVIVDLRGGVLAGSFKLSMSEPFVYHEAWTTGGGILYSGSTGLGSVVVSVRGAAEAVVGGEPLLASRAAAASLERVDPVWVYLGRGETSLEGVYPFEAYDAEPRGALKIGELGARTGYGPVLTVAVYTIASAVLVYRVLAGRPSPW